MIKGQQRGEDATGISFNIKKNYYLVSKSPVTAIEFVTSKKYTEPLEKHNPTIVIAHNRQFTQGTPKDNNNNHPVVVPKSGLQMVHNGIITNDDEVAKDYKLSRNGAVDTEVVLRLIDYYIKKGFGTKKAIRLTARKVKGGLTFALLNPKEPQTLYLVASDNPLWFAFHKPTGTIFFASTEDILEEGLTSYATYFQGFFMEKLGIENYVLQEATEDRCYKITRQGWSSFEIKRPDPYSFHNRSVTDDEADSSTQYQLTTDTRPIEYEKLGNKKIKGIVEEFEEFDPANEIRRPSIYPSELLLWRLEWLQDLFTSGDIRHQLDKEYTLTRVESEVARLISSLTDRKKITKRKIYIPKPKEIITKTLSPAKLKKVKYILLDRNDHLLKNFGKEMEDAILQESSIREALIDSR